MTGMLGTPTVNTFGGEGSQRRGSSSSNCSGRSAHTMPSTAQSSSMAMASPVPPPSPAASAPAGQYADSSLGGSGSSSQSATLRMSAGFNGKNQQRAGGFGHANLAVNDGTSFLTPLPTSAQLAAHASSSGASSSSPGSLRASAVSAMLGHNSSHTQPMQASGTPQPPHGPSSLQSSSSNIQQIHQPPSPLMFSSSFLATQQQQQAAQMAVDRYTADLTNYIIAFLSPILPTEEEYRIKEATRRQLERLAGRVSPGAKLLAFGSMANGFALKNSDMDLCCLLANSEGDTSNPPHDLNASELVEILGNVIREETDFNVMPLPKARIPIIKISRPHTSDLPYDISCDIGFENRLALENTRLLLSYAMVDPPRLRTLVLFLKVWTKRRKLNSPFTGTLSSYGYTLMMLYFLIHVKRPAVLPNLQRIPPSSGSTSKSQDAKLNGHEVYFYDDVATLRREWSSHNTENVGELLLEFFRYFSKEYSYSREAISIRTETGSVPKESRNWTSELCIEDPFQSGYNVARTVTKDGLYTIRGEFMRASRILTTRIDRVSAALAELCEEREDGLTRAPSPSYSHRHRMANMQGYHGQHMYLPGGGFDPRYLRDVTRRFDARLTSNGFGGSFAFEEMAKGLAQAQKGPTMAFPPTAAMLAPLSQSPSLGPHQTLMRAGLRYDATANGQPVMSNSAQPSKVPSSARSEDGGSSSCDRRRSKRTGTTPTNRAIALPPLKSRGHDHVANGGAASSRTSPSMDHPTPQGLLHTNSSLQGAYGIGEAFAYGSEISFGSQRFQLHPPSASSAQQSENLQQNGQHRASRSFSDGVNRSKSLPRSVLEANSEALRRTSTPMLSEPPSPTHNSMRAGTSLPTQSDAVAALDPSLASLSLRTSGRTSTSSQRTASSRSSLSGVGSHHSQPEIALGKSFGSDDAGAPEDGGQNGRLLSAHTKSKRASSTLSAPLPFSQPAADAGPWIGRASSTLTAGRSWDAYDGDNAHFDDQRARGAVDDDAHSSISDETLDELARASALESSDDDIGDGQDRNGKAVFTRINDDTLDERDAQPSEASKMSADTVIAHQQALAPLSVDKDSDVRSWAAAQHSGSPHAAEQALPAPRH